MKETQKQKVKNAANAVGWTMTGNKAFVFSKEYKNGNLTVKVEQKNVCGNLLKMLLTGKYSSEQRQEVFQLYKSLEKTLLWELSGEYYFWYSPLKKIWRYLKCKNMIIWKM